MKGLPLYNIATLIYMCNTDKCVLPHRGNIADTSGLLLSSLVSLSAYVAHFTN